VAAVNEVLAPQELRYPADAVERRRLADDFRELANFPSVGGWLTMLIINIDIILFISGCLDGTLVTMVTPRDNEADYVDRRGARYHSLNIAAVCDAHMKFLYVYCNRPGSTHDSRVWTESAMGESMADGNLPFPRAVILGDAGYGCSSYLLTPLRQGPLDPASAAYNSSHKRTRVVIERAFGIAKSRFQILKHSQYSPHFTAQIVWRVNLRFSGCR